MDCTDLNVFDEEDVIEPCRACGIYFISSQGAMQPLFGKIGTGDYTNDNMPEIVQQMNEWNLGVFLCKPC